MITAAVNCCPRGLPLAFIVTADRNEKSRQGNIMASNAFTGLLNSSADRHSLFDDAQGIARNAPRIYQQAVQLKAMPLANMTNMTDAERAQLGAWYESGAKTR